VLRASQRDCTLLISFDKHTHTLVLGHADPRSDGNLRSGLGSLGADSPHNSKLYGMNGDGEGNEGPARTSVHELLALVEAERNKMSKAVLSSADGLSSAVTMARKRLAANIAAVEEQLREEKRLLEQARGEQPLTASTASTAELQALLSARDVELESHRREKRALEDERQDLRNDLAKIKRELMESKQRATAAVESAAALQAEVNVLRGNLKGGETFPLPLPVPGGYSLCRLVYHMVLDPSSQLSSLSCECLDLFLGCGAEIVQPASSRDDTKESALVPKVEERVVVMETMLRRKKTDHGMFEDPWKLRMMCTLSNGVLEAVVVQDGRVGAGEKWETTYDLKKDWYLPPDRRVGGSKTKFDPVRFDLVRKSSGEVASFKAETLEQTGSAFALPPASLPLTLTTLSCTHTCSSLYLSRVPPPPASLSHIQTPSRAYHTRGCHPLIHERMPPSHAHIGMLLSFPASLAFSLHTCIYI